VASTDYRVEETFVDLGSSLQDQIVYLACCGKQNLNLGYLVEKRLGRPEYLPSFF